MREECKHCTHYKKFFIIFGPEYCEFEYDSPSLYYNSLLNKNCQLFFPKLEKAGKGDK